MKVSVTANSRFRLAARVATVLCVLVVMGAGAGVAFAAADTTPPTTYGDIEAVYNDTATITLNAFDSAEGTDAVPSGVDKTFYRVDGAGAFLVGTTVVVTTAGDHTLEFYSIDLAGNKESTQSASFAVVTDIQLDKTAPNTISNAKPAYPVSPAVIVLTATDGPEGSGLDSINYVVDGGAVVTGQSPLTITIPGGGISFHTLQFWSVDKAGNAEGRRTAMFSIGNKITIKASRSSARIGQSVVISGSAGPITGSVRVQVKAARKTTWATLTTRRVVPGSHTTIGWSSYTYRLKKGMAKGTYQFRAVYSGSGLTSATSRVVKVSVK